MKLVILEGPDGSGKTTLAKESRHLEYIHFGPPPKGKDGAWRQYFNLLVDLWDSPRPGGVIIDRFIHGEMIYGPLLRGGTDLTWAHIRMLERIVMGMSGKLVVCLPPWETVLSNWQRSKDELLKDEAQLEQTYAFYRFLLHGERRMVPRGVFDYTNLHNPGIEGPFINEGPGIGLFAPGNTLVVGDEVNKRTGKEGWPFVAPGGSSLWLANLLEEARVPEHGLYWINAKTNGADTDPSFLPKLNPGKVVALGLNAAKWCNQHAPGEYYTFCHPQYHKRFWHNEPYPLIYSLT